jgi:hypothetical protein
MLILMRRAEAQEAELQALALFCRNAIMFSLVLIMHPVRQGFVCASLNALASSTSIQLSQKINADAIGMRMITNR